MIGNSPFQEHLQGDIRDLQIWNRGLDDEDIAGLYSEKRSNTRLISVLIILLLLIVFVTIFLFLRKRRKAFINTVLKVEKTAVIQAPKTEVLQNSLLLFGEFALYNSSGENLAAQMSPKTKQLFLLVILKTLLEDGVSTRELNDMLWPGMNDAAAKNNRGVTVHNQRQALSASNGLKLDNTEKHWTMNGRDNYYIDLQTFRNQRALFSESNHNFALLSDLLNIISKPFLQNLQAEWLDLYKNTINEDHLDWLMRIAEMPQITEQPEILLKIATAMFAIDEVNENALQIRIDAYRKKGNEAMVRKSIESFKKKYLHFYNEEYSNMLF
jgi:DNA-binding SARP family transcriptional activator